MSLITSQNLLFFVIILAAVVLGWLLGKWERKRSPLLKQRGSPIEPQLSYLLNNPHDKAIENFIKSLEVNNDTVDTHLSLGTLFRNRGEVKKAISVHQNLLGQPYLAKKYALKVQMELAKDYITVGLHDRAKQLLIELSHAGKAYQKPALEQLLTVYQQAKDWPEALVVAEQLVALGDARASIVRTHYCCEMAQTALSQDDHDLARAQLQRALSYDPRCARASLLEGQLEYQLGHYQVAIKALQRIAQQDTDYLTEALDLLDSCYQNLGDYQGFQAYLEKCFELRPSVSVLLLLEEQRYRSQGLQAAMRYLAEKLKIYPSLRGVNRILDRYLLTTQGQTREDLIVLRRLTGQLVERKPVYRCGHCGYSGKTLHWLCPSCQRWGTICRIYGIEGE
jgi:lipopolysaccharide biosynthesis regulator YciM